MNDSPQSPSTQSKALWVAVIGLIGVIITVAFTSRNTDKTNRTSDDTVRVKIAAQVEAEKRGKEATIVAEITKRVQDLEALTDDKAGENSRALAAIADQYPDLAVPRICAALRQVASDRDPPKKQIIIQGCSVIDKLGDASKQELKAHDCYTLLQTLRTHFANQSDVLPSIDYAIQRLSKLGLNN